MNASDEPARGGFSSAIGRGSALFAGLGGVLAGVAGTLDWPIVGTFFGVLEGALAGAAFGVVDAVLLAALARATPSLWAARATSGVVTGAAALMTAAVYAAPLDSATPVALVTIAALAGAVFGPLIAFGMEPTPAGWAPGEIPCRVCRFLAWGAAVGAGAGAVTGVVIGIRTYAPTAGFAAVEGATLGVVTGLMLGCLAAAASLLPRVRPRR